MKVYSGACHCGEVKYEVCADISSAIECNCSMCSKKGTLLAFVPLDQFTLIEGEKSLSTYKFNRNVIDHHFCKTCGVTPFLAAQDRAGNKVQAINVRCLDNIDIKSLDVKHVDGRSF